MTILIFAGGKVNPFQGQPMNLNVFLSPEDATRLFATGILATAPTERVAINIVITPDPDAAAKTLQHQVINAHRAGLQ